MGNPFLGAVSWARYLWGSAAIDIGVAIIEWLLSWRRGEVVDGVSCPGEDTLRILGGPARVAEQPDRRASKARARCLSAPRTAAGLYGEAPAVCRLRL